MLKVNILAIGKIKEKYILDGIDEFSKRMRPYISFNIYELSEAKDSEISAKKDSESIIKFLEKKNSYNILLDLNAKEIDSTQLADMIAKLSITNSELTFIIGGSRGHSDELRSFCNTRLSFSKLTFPHQLFRLILTEQIYRSVCILNNIKYHK